MTGGLTGRAGWRGGLPAVRRQAPRRQGPASPAGPGGQDVSRQAPGQRRRSRHQEIARVPGKISARPGASAARGRLREPTKRRRLTQPGATPPGPPTPVRQLASGRARARSPKLWSSGCSMPRLCTRCRSRDWLARCIPRPSPAEPAGEPSRLLSMDSLTAVRRSVVRGLADLHIAPVETSPPGSSQASWPPALGCAQNATSPRTTRSPTTRSAGRWRYCGNAASSSASTAAGPSCESLRLQNPDRTQDSVDANMFGTGPP
jgi:hypothetical protein